MESSLECQCPCRRNARLNFEQFWCTYGDDIESDILRNFIDCRCRSWDDIRSELRNCRDRKIEEVFLIFKRADLRRSQIEARSVVDRFSQDRKRDCWRSVSIRRWAIDAVIGQEDDGQLAVRGLYIGDDPECFERAAELSLEVNFLMLDEEPKKIVAYLDPEEFHSTWLGNKAIYRTRMLIADAGELIVLAPAVGTFGEDKQIDALIRKYGYRTTPEVMQLVADHDDLRQNLSAAAHLIHGSSEGRFRVTYCPGKLTREEIESVGYAFGDLDEMLKRYDPARLKDGWNTVDGERSYFVRNPALGLWASRGRFA